MYRQDGNGWDDQEPRGAGGNIPNSQYPDNYNNDNNLNVGFQPNSAAFEYMRSLDSQSGEGRMTPPRQQGDYPPQQRGHSPPPPPPGEHSPNYGRQGRTPRRTRRTTRAAVTGGGGPGPSSEMPGPLPSTSRMVSEAPISMPPNRPILMSGPGSPGRLPNDHMNDPGGPGAPPASMPMSAYAARGNYDDDAMPTSSRPNSGPSPYDNMNGPPPGPTSDLHEGASDGSYMPDAPYQNMMNSYSNNPPDPTVERARSIMASRGDSSNTDSRPMPIAGRPMAPETSAIEPAVPPAQLRRRILINKPKREPDLVRGKVVKQITPSSKKTHVLCAGCGVMLQISKTAIVVHCRNCNGVHPTASCRIPTGGP